jgi:hypothetical protein
MSHVTHHHLGDSGSSHGSHHSRELSISHHHSSTFHALHHEATASLSSPHTTAAHSEKSGIARPAAAKASDSVHIAAKTNHVAKAESAVHIATGNKAEKPAVKADKVAHSLDFSVPNLSIVNDGRSQTAKAAQSKANFDLASLVPQHLTDKPAVVRTAAAAPDASTNLFARPLTEKAHAPAADIPANPAANLPRLDVTRTLADMVYAGAIVDRTSATVEQGEKAKLNPGEVPSIKVSLQNPTDTQTKPDFVVKQDGTVEMLNNPQKSGQKEIVIQFERNGDQTNLSDAQKQAGGNLYTYLSEQLKSQFPQVKPEAFKVDDSQGLLRDTQLPAEVKKNLEKQQQKADVSPESGLPERSGRTMQDTRRISQGGSHSSVPRGDIDNMTPPVKRIPNEADRVAAMKDTIASYVSRGDQHPYDYVAKRGDRGWGVGRYGQTFNQFGSWLAGLSDEQIEELIKQGKLSPKQGANLKKMRDSVKKAQETGNDGDLHPFLKAMKNGEGTEEEMKAGVQEFMPDKVQELAASDQIAKITGDLSKDAIARGEKPSVNPGQVALSFVLGRTVGKEEYEGKPEYKNFVESANQAYRMQEQARIQGGAIINVENMSQVGQALNQMVGQQFWREAAGATEYGNKGCAIAVTRMLQHMGVQIGTHLDVTGTAQDCRARGWQEVSLNDAIRSGQLYVAVNKETGSHVGLGLGRQVWENSSGQRQVVTRDIGGSTLRNSGRAFIVPIQAGDKKTA